MNLYHISQTANNDYDTYSDAVVAAHTPSRARNMHPSGSNDPFNSTWVKPEDVTVKYLGKAKRGTKEGVICSSFHAG